MAADLSLAPVDADVLTPVARAALGRPAAVVTGREPPAPLTNPEAVFNPSSGGVYRVRGTAAQTGASLPWSAILKVLRSPAGEAR